MSVLDTTAPVLSVIVVSADSGPSLRDCVNSVLACTTPLEVLLIDNASSDGIPQAIARARENDPRLKVIYNRANLGFGPAINLAAAQARGSALLMLNPDCTLDEFALQRLLQVL
ncbi:MAG TPA: glycosyltransferase, partial [Rhodanobacter sp.]